MTNTVIFRESRSGAFGDSEDGTYPVVLLTPGQGATAYYSEEVIRRDAPEAFPKGTHIYLNHLQEGETRTPEKLLGTLVEQTSIRESDGAAVNRFKPYKRWREFVDEVKNDVGLSINAAGSARLGMVDGRSTKIAESIQYHRTNSVDLVSYPGREGSGFTESATHLIEEAVEDFRESYVQPEPSASGEPKGNKMAELTEETAKSLVESAAALATLVESLKPAPAAGKVEGEIDIDAERAKVVEAIRTVESAEVSTSVKNRLIEGIKNGAYDVKPEIDAAIALREEYKAEFQATFNESVGAAGAAGGEAPKVKGWGA